MSNIALTNLVTAEMKTAEARRSLEIAVNNERERRIVAGTIIDGMLVTGRDVDQINLLALKDTARDLKAAGINGMIIPFRDGNNVDRLLTADQMIALANAGKTYVSTVYAASWALKAMTPIPNDLTEDVYWP
jgi:hypothetical protein